MDDPLPWYPKNLWLNPVGLRCHVQYVHGRTKSRTSFSFRGCFLTLLKLTILCWKWIKPVVLKKWSAEWVNFDHFESSTIFGGSWGSIENWLEPKTKSGYLACPNRWNIFCIKKILAFSNFCCKTCVFDTNRKKIIDRKMTQLNREKWKNSLLVKENSLIGYATGVHIF